jgi:hypothetical protein
MSLFKYLQLYGAAIPEPGRPEDEIESTVNYIVNGNDYKDRVKRAHSVKFTYQLPQVGRQQPRSMDKVERFLNGEWRRHEWEAYDLKQKTAEDPKIKSDRNKKAGFIRKLIWSFFGAIFIDLILGSIIWLIIMMGISELGLERRFGVEIDPINVLIGTLAVGFVLFFLGFLGFIKTD